MDEKIFNNLVNADFVADYEQKYAQIDEAEQKVIADNVVAEELCEQEVANVTNTMETFKLIVMEKLQTIEEKSKQELAVAQEQHLADLKQCENRINSAQKAFAKATKENTTKSTKLKNANTKLVAEIEKRHKTETTAAAAAIPIISEAPVSGLSSEPLLEPPFPEPVLPPLEPLPLPEPLKRP